MQIIKKRLLAGVLGSLAIGGVMAQSYPSKPIRFIVPFTAGSGTDIIARTIAATQVARGEADGYTVLVHSSGHALNPGHLHHHRLRHAQGSHRHHAAGGLAQCAGQ